MCARRKNVDANNVCRSDDSCPTPFNGSRAVLSKRWYVRTSLALQVKVVTTMLQPYSYYLQQNGSSLLSRMYAMFSVGKTVYLVQGNIANTQHIRGHCLSPLQPRATINPSGLRATAGRPGV